jgi:hypothetical protein
MRLAAATGSKWSMCNGAIYNFGNAAAFQWSAVVAVG